MHHISDNQDGFTLSKTAATLLGLGVIVIALIAFFVFKPETPQADSASTIASTSGQSTDAANTAAGAAASTASASNVALTMPAKEYIKRISNPDSKFKLTIEDNKVVSGPTKITVKQGQSVNVDLATPDEEVVVQLAGYDIITETSRTPGASGGLHFIADKPGTFKFWIPGDEDGDEPGEPLHDVQLGTITVKPE